MGYVSGLLLAPRWGVEFNCIHGGGGGRRGVLGSVRQRAGDIRNVYRRLSAGLDIHALFSVHDDVLAPARCHAPGLSAEARGPLVT